MEDSLVENVLTTSGEWLWVVGILAGAVLLGILVHLTLMWMARRVLGRDSEGALWQDTLLIHLVDPLRVLVPSLFVSAVVPSIQDRLLEDLFFFLDGGVHVIIVAATAWLIARALRAGEEVVAERYSIEVSDNLKARKIVTQVRILRRVATVAIVVLAVGIMLLRYEPFQELGTGILASAGIVGIVVGIAAQRTLSDVIAGLQIALTQPIRVDDVVIVEGEFGWVEEITLTYVVVRVWDRRRIVLPITHFVENPFQNWTRTSADLIGSVFLRVDYRTPVQEIRDHLRRVVEESEYWDGDVCALHVTDAGERSLELRAIASAKNAPQLWELRCQIRERLVEYLRDEYPEAFPVFRAQIQDDTLSPPESSVGNRAGTE